MKARKRFGQHFLTDTSVVDAMVRAIAPKRSDHLVEIGPGRAALTEPLYAEVDRLTLIELDRDLLPLLKAAFGNAEVVHADVLDVTLTDVAEPPLRVVGNLPYNISSPLILKLLHQLDDIKDMHFMLQREMAARIAAQPGTKAWGRLSVQVQYHCEVEHLFDVAPDAFTPPPKVDSSVVRLLPRSEKLELADSESFDQVLRSVFSARRKRLANALKQFDVAWDWQALDMDANVRAEQVSLENFVALANQLAASPGR